MKRIVGLPGESVQIRDGDVYIDGEIQRKTLAEQKRLAVLVHDADYSPRLSKDVPPSGAASRIARIGIPPAEYLHTRKSRTSDKPIG